MSDSYPALMTYAQARFHRGGPVGCLVLHGFMASPGEVGWLGEHLAEAGHTVLVPRLPGHGWDPRAMRLVRWHDWYTHALDQLAMLRQHCEKIIVIGHSMGGMLTLRLVASQAVDGVVVAGTPFLLDSLILRHSRLVSYVLPFTNHPTEAELNAVIRAEQERRGEQITGRVHYQRWHSRAVYELYLLMQEAKAAAPKVTSPLLMLYADGDTTATARDRDWLAQNNGSRDPRLYKLGTGGHIIFQDVGREEAFGVVGDFVAEIGRG